MRRVVVFSIAAALVCALLAVTAMSTSAGALISIIPGSTTTTTAPPAPDVLVVVFKDAVSPNAQARVIRKVHGTIASYHGPMVIADVPHGTSTWALRKLRKNAKVVGAQDDTVSPPDSTCPNAVYDTQSGSVRFSPTMTINVKICWGYTQPPFPHELTMTLFVTGGSCTDGGTFTSAVSRANGTKYGSNPYTAAVAGSCTAGSKFDGDSVDATLSYSADNTLLSEGFNSSYDFSCCASGGFYPLHSNPPGKHIPLSSGGGGGGRQLGWAGWDPPGANTTSCANATPDLVGVDLFWIDCSGNVQHSNSTNHGTSWNPPEPLGAPVASPQGSLEGSPTVLSRNGRLDVFVHDSYCRIFWKYVVTNHGWSGWQQIGGSSACTSSDIAATESSTLDIYFTDATTRLVHMYSDGVSWSSPEALTYYGVYGTPTAVLTGPGDRVHVLVDVGLTQKPIDVYWDSATGWSQPAKTAPDGTGSICTLLPTPAVSLSPGNLDAYALSSCVGGVQVMMHATLRNGTWSGWSELVGTCVLGGPPSIAQHDGLIDVFHVGCNGHVYQQTSNNGNLGSQWTDRGNGSSIGTSASSTFDGTGTDVLVAITASNQTVQIGEDVR